MVHWKQGKTQHTAEFCVITEATRWSTNFCSMGTATDTEGVITDWDHLDPKTMALDLVAITGQEEWTEDAVRDYGMQCIVAQVAGELISQGKRGIIGSDHTHGSMTKLWDTMTAMGEFTLNRVGAQVEIGEPTHDGVIRISPGFAYMARFDVRKDDKWFNPNSGNHVHWLMADLRGDGEEWDSMIECWNCGHSFSMTSDGNCPHCEEWNEYDPDDCGNFREGRYEISKEVAAVYGSVEFRRRARRYYWRNG
jgi:hypothetical protein